MKIEIYGTEYCPYCDAAKQMLDQKKIDYTYTDLSNNEELRVQLVKKHDYRTVPMIFVDEEFIGGFTDLQKLNLS